MRCLFFFSVGSSLINFFFQESQNSIPLETCSTKSSAIQIFSNQTQKIMLESILLFFFNFFWISYLISIFFLFSIIRFWLLMLAKIDFSCLFKNAVKLVKRQIYWTLFQKIKLEFRMCLQPFFILQILSFFCTPTSACIKKTFSKCLEVYFKK